jgi:hypothetical protein
MPGRCATPLRSAARPRRLRTRHGYRRSAFRWCVLRRRAQDRQLLYSGMPTCAHVRDRHAQFEAVTGSVAGGGPCPRRRARSRPGIRYCRACAAAAWAGWNGTALRARGRGRHGACIHCRMDGLHRRRPRRGVHGMGTLIVDRFAPSIGASAVVANEVRLPRAEARRRTPSLRTSNPAPATVTGADHTPSGRGPCRRARSRPLRQTPARTLFRCLSRGRRSSRPRRTYGSRSGQGMSRSCDETGESNRWRSRRRACLPLATLTCEQSMPSSSPARPDGGCAPVLPSVGGIAFPIRPRVPAAARVRCLVPADSGQESLGFGHRIALHEVAATAGSGRGA